MINPITPAHIITSPKTTINIAPPALTVTITIVININNISAKIINKIISITPFVIGAVKHAKKLRGSVRSPQLQYSVVI